MQKIVYSYKHLIPAETSATPMLPGLRTTVFFFKEQELSESHMIQCSYQSDRFVALV